MTNDEKIAEIQDELRKLIDKLESLKTGVDSWGYPTSLTDSWGDSWS